MATTWAAPCCRATHRTGFVDFTFTCPAPLTGAMASILFLAPADLGETVLATGALAHVLDEDAELTVLTSADARPLFRASPGLKAQYTVEGISDVGRFIELAWSRRARRFDLLLDMRRTPAALVLPARQKFVLPTPEVLRHFSEDVSALVGSARTLAPTIWLDDRARQAAANVASDAAPVLLIAPGGASAAKRWPQERFAAIARRLATGALAGARTVVLSAATRDDEIAARIVSSLDADGVRASGAGLDMLAAAALAERATLCIGNDNALTHIAAAMGAPTLTLFGPTDERVRSPRGPRARTLRGKSFEEAALDAGGAMDDISIDAVEAAALDLLRAGGLR
ncbi:MAG: glycosyltransferase family 9 protein [Hyphomonadaceae bacterium]